MKDNHTNNDSLDTLRRRWQGIRVDSDKLDSANRDVAENITRENPLPLQYRLARRHTRTSFVGLTLVPTAYLLHAVLGLGVWLCVAYAVFGLVMCVFNRLLADYISERPLTEMAVAEAVRRAVLIRLRQRQIRIAGIVMGGAVLAFLGVELFDVHRDDALLGMGCGLVAGLAIAVPRAVRMSRLARRLVASLQADASDGL